MSRQCLGFRSDGKPCDTFTSRPDGYCFWHQEQIDPAKRPNDEKLKAWAEEIAFREAQKFLAWNKPSVWDKPTACQRPPWWETLLRIDAEKIKLLRDFQESLRLAKKGKKDGR